MTEFMDGEDMNPWMSDWRQFMLRPVTTIDAEIGKHELIVAYYREQRPNAPNLPMAEMNFIGLRRHRDRMNGKRVMYVRDQDGVEAMKIVRS